MGHRFINAYAAGLCTAFLMLAVITHNKPLFIIEAVLVAFNLAVYFHGESDK